MQKTGIEYLTHTWNPIAMRCSPASIGCTNCWHLRTADRLKNNPGLPEDERKALAGEGPFVLRERELSEPLKLKKPAVIGVQFMGDLFHEDVPDAFQNQAFITMSLAKQHTFLVLTKRPEIMAKAAVGWRAEMDNVYFGVTVVNQSEADAKIPELLKVPGKKWLSVEPLLGPIDLDDLVIKDGPRSEHHIGCLWCDVDPEDDNDFHGETIDAVVLGGETGPGARPMHPDWVRSVRDQCAAAGVPFYFKQWGEWRDSIEGVTRDRVFEPEQLRYLNDDGTIAPLGMGYTPSRRFLSRVGSKAAGRTLDGREWNEVPWRTE
ncbi:MAG: phage Gp37/Gp68 family protein [Syntrophorhabdaceae bacterium]